MVSNKITQEEGKIYLIIHTKTVTKQQIQWSSTNKTFHSSVLKSRVQSGLVSSAWCLNYTQLTAVFHSKKPQGFSGLWCALPHLVTDGGIPKSPGTRISGHRAESTVQAWGSALQESQSLRPLHKRTIFFRDFWDFWFICSCFCFLLVLNACWPKANWLSSIRIWL